MEMRLIFRSLVVCGRIACVVSDLLDCPGLRSGFQEIAPPYRPYPETDTGGLVEYTKALERRVLKELGKLPPYLRKKEARCKRKLSSGAQAQGGSDCLNKKHRALLSRLQDDV